MAIPLEHGPKGRDSVNYSANQLRHCTGPNVILVPFALLRKYMSNVMSLMRCGGHFPVLFVAGGVEDKVEAVLQPEEEGDDEADVGDVVVVVAADELEGDDGQVADEVAHADGADGLGHALVSRRQLVPHVVAEESGIQIG